METSLRYGGDTKTLRINAKEKLSIGSNTFLQVQAELDTRFGDLNYCTAMLRHVYPDLSASFGLGVRFDEDEKLLYSLRGKKAISVSSNGLVSFNIKGRFDTDKVFGTRKSKLAAEFVSNVLNFQKDQDVRLKVGYDFIDKVTYMQIRENNWTVNADSKARWNIRYDL